MTLHNVAKPASSPMTAGFLLPQAVARRIMEGQHFVGTFVGTFWNRPEKVPTGANKFNLDRTTTRGTQWR
jgi:hypothetical protein